MKEYFFQNWREDQYTPYTEYEIKDDDFRNLFSICERYSTVLCLTFWPIHKDIREKLKKYELGKEESLPFAANAPWKTWDALNKDYHTENIFYHICPELMQILSEMGEYNLANFSRFDNPDNPEDPTFFRSDASIFFHPVVHEGMALLCARDDEDVSTIVCRPGWD